MARIDFSSRVVFLNVKELANFAVKSIQDTILDYSPILLNSLKKGREWHEIIQLEYNKQAESNQNFNCLTEVFLSGKIGKIKGWSIILRGRADIITYSKLKNQLDIIEIKSSTSIKENQSNLFWKNQVLFYYWLFSNLPNKKMSEIFKELGISVKSNEINYFLKLLIVNSFTGHQLLEEVELNQKELNNEISVSVNKIFDYFIPRIDHIEKFRLIKELPWFFDEFRKGQIENIKKIQGSLKSHSIVMEIGPPGTGKTAINLRVLLEESIKNDKQIFYSSTKNSQQKEVLNIIERINFQLKNPLWAVSLLAKEKYCVNNDVEVCEPYECDYFLSMKKKESNYINIFNDNPIASVEFLKERAIQTKSFCPYYKSKYLAGFADIVIGDQNFILSPDIKLGILSRYNHPLLFSKKGLPYLYLLDEAHNLPSRVRDELSLSIDLNELKTSIKTIFLGFSMVNESIQSKLEKICLQIYNSISEFPVYKIPDNLTPPSALEILNKPLTIDTKSINYLQYKSEEGQFNTINITKTELFDFKELLEVFHSLLHILEEKYSSDDVLYELESIVLFNKLKDIGNLFNKLMDAISENIEGNLQLFYHRQQSKIKLESYYLNIANYINQELKGTQASFLMSATLHPEFFYRTLFNFPPNVKYIELTNYFPEKNRSTIVIKDIKTRFREINREETLTKICNIISLIYTSKSGKYLVFTPNLMLMKKINSILKKKVKLCITQDEFDQNSFKEGIIVCALGSVFSEGINLPNLTGVIIISPGIPPPSYKNNLLMEYYKLQNEQKSNQEAFDLAFKIPGINKILQSAGRLHRKPEDKGIIYLLGERFSNENYLEFYPPFLKPIKIIESNQLENEIKKFWYSK